MPVQLILELVKIAGMILTHFLTRKKKEDK